MPKRTVLSLFAFAVAALGADPVVGTVTVKPTFAPANTPTQVTITALITDTSLSANGANVQRLNSAGNPTAVLGILHDDGLNGDAVAGDRVYTLVFTLNEPTPGRIFFRTAAAFQGVVQRVSSSSVAVDIANVASPLSIDAATAPAPNAAGWNKSDVSVTFSCAGGAGGSDSCPGIVRVTSEGQAQAIPGTATDGAANSATKSVSINLDKTAPILNITSPANGVVVSTPAITVTGTVTDALSGVATFTCNGQTASVNGSAFSCNLPLVPGTNAIAVQATDLAGNTATSNLNVTYSISTLTISASPSPAPNAAGWNNTDVTVEFSCSGDATPITCPQSVVISNEGGNQVISRTATDAAGSTATASVTLKIDKTRPTLSITSPAAAATVTTPQITVIGTVADALSGVAKVTCNSVTAVLNGQAFSCNLTLVAGLNTIVVQATDVAGNTAASNLSVTLGTALTISATPSPASNAAGWNNSNVTVTFTCAGGVATVTCPQPVVVSIEGANQVISRTATDGAGNTATASVTLKIDKTPPAVAISAPAPGATVTTPQITVTGTVTDALSGIASATCNGSPAALTQSNLSCNLTLTAGLNTIIVQATDIAGNSTPISFPVSFATPTLTISASPSPAPNAAGWNSANVTVTFTCSGGTGTVTCPQPVVVSTEGANQTISRTATDSAGNNATASVSLKIDKTAPVVAISSPTPGATVITSPITVTGTVADALSGIASATCNGSPATLTQSALSCSVTLVAGPNTIAVQVTDLAGNTATSSVSVTFSPITLTVSASPSPAPNAAGWNKSDVTITFTCAGGTAPVTCPQPVVTSTEGANQVISRTATDSAGHTATASVTLKIDKTPPTTTIASPVPGATVITSPITVTGTVTDALSGIASATCNGSPATLTQSALSCSVTLVAGPNTIAVQATDLAGNTATSSVSVTFSPTALTISASPSPAPNVAGWNKSDVTITFTCAGGTAPVTCPQPVVISTEGANQVISRTATDSAGHSATASVTLKIDKTPPTTTIASPVPGATITASPITVTGTVTDSLSGIAGATCNSSPATLTQPNLSCNVTLVAGANTIVVQATDIAGNSTTTSIPVTFTPTGLSITTSLTPPPNAAGWNKSNVTVTFICAGGTPPLTCPPPVVVSTETAGQVVSGTVTDSAAKTATASVTIKLDKTPPSVSISSPANGTIVTVTLQTISGTLTEALSGIASLTCNGAAATIVATAFNCSVSLSSGSNSIAISAADVAGNTGTSSLTLIYAFIPPTVTLTAPANLSYLNITPTTVNGTVSDPTATVTVNGLAAPVSNGSFSIALPLLEGPNIISATATTPGGAAGTASIQVTLDMTPPHVTITSPPDQFVTTDTAISVSGIVNDIVVGTVNDQQATVKVNGAQAQVANRTFLATNVPLALGSNTIQAVGRDRAGNAATTQITVTRQPPSTQSQIRLISGNNQTGPIGSLVSAPLVVALTDAAGNPVPNKPIVFKVTQDDGLVSAGAASASSAIATTNAQGQAQAQWRLGMRAGAGANAVEAYAVGYGGTAIFTATGTQGPAGKIVIDTGNNQVGAVNQPLPLPLIAVVVDSGNNRLGNVPVTFAVQQGGGNFAGQTTYTVNTDSDGRAAATLTLGFQEGNANNLVTATFPVNQSFPATFTASGRAPGSPANTTITGVVLDNSNVAIPGVTLRALLTNVLTSNANAVSSAVTAQTNAQGQFSIKPAPVGFVKLMVDGSTAQRPGVYPSLEYDLVTVAGQTATVGQPIFLLPLNPANQLCVTATTGGGTLTIPEAPGFSLTFGPGQVTFPGGSKDGCVSVTVVHGDKVPMSPGFGQQPRFIVTIQPTGALFNPPAPITLPNVDGLAPRAVTEMYSFDHDIGSFVAIGTGTVSDDGLMIRSNQGVGVLKAGWHCGGDPNANGTVADCPTCSHCIGNACVPDPNQAGASCQNACIVGGAGTCANGACAGGTPVNCSDGNVCNGIETCNPATGCQAGTPLQCDDHNVCNGIETCDPALGCRPGTPLACNNQNACIGQTTCDAVLGCTTGTRPPNGSSCGACFTGGTCSGGACVGGTPVNCDDGNVCNGTETCDSVTGCKPGTPLNCSSGNPCLDDGCSTTAGCTHTDNQQCQNACNGRTSGSCTVGNLTGTCDANANCNLCGALGANASCTCGGGVIGTCGGSGQCNCPQVTVNITSFFSNQLQNGIRGNGLDRALSPPFKTGFNGSYVFMGGANDGLGHAIVTFDVSPSSQAASSTLLARFIGHGSAGISSGDSTILSVSGSTVTALVQSGPLGVFVGSYDLIVGVDSNGDRQLDRSEQLAQSQLYFNIVPQLAYTGSAATLLAAASAGAGACSALATILGIGQVSGPCSTAPNFLLSFLLSSVPLGALPTVNTVTEAQTAGQLLHHRVGVSFTPDGTPQFPQYVFPPDGSIATEIRGSVAFRNKLSDFQAIVTTYFSNNPNATVHTFTQTLSPQIQFLGSSDFDLGIAFGAAALSNAAITFTVNKDPTNGHLIVTSASVTSGDLIDIYNWNYDDSTLAQLAAEVQAGYPTLGGSGRVFSEDVQLQGSVAVPLGGVIYDFGAAP